MANMIKRFIAECNRSIEDMGIELVIRRDGGFGFEARERDQCFRQALVSDEMSVHSVLKELDDIRKSNKVSRLFPPFRQDERQVWIRNHDHKAWELIHKDSKESCGIYPYDSVIHRHSELTFSITIDDSDDVVTYTVADLSYW